MNVGNHNRFKIQLHDKWPGGENLITSLSQKFVQTFSLYKFGEPVLNYTCNKFVALTNLCEMGPSSEKFDDFICAFLPGYLIFTSFIFLSFFLK